MLIVPSSAPKHVTIVDEIIALRTAGWEISSIPSSIL